MRSVAWAVRVIAFLLCFARVYARDTTCLETTKELSLKTRLVLLQEQNLHSALITATENYLNNQAKKRPKNSPKKFIFVGLHPYKIIQFLGEGNEGQLYLVQTKEGAKVVKAFNESANWTWAETGLYLFDSRHPGIRAIHILKSDNFRHRHLSDYVYGIPLTHLDPESPEQGMELGLTRDQIKLIRAAIADQVSKIDRENGFIFPRKNLFLDIRSFEVVVTDEH